MSVREGERKGSWRVSVREGERKGSWRVSVREEKSESEREEGERASASVAGLASPDAP